MAPAEAVVRYLESAPSSVSLPKTAASGFYESTRLALRERAMAADAAATIEMSLALLWRELMGGLCHVVDGFFSPTRCYLVLAPAVGAPLCPAEGRRRQILEAVLLGQSQKTIAIDLDLAPSTIALNSRLALKALGVDGKPSRAHPLIMLAAKAGKEHGSPLAATLSFVEHQGEPLRVVAVPRPDRGLSDVLPRAELAVIRALVEGFSYAEIGRQRDTSVRTIANQITAVFRRMRVSGRNELLIRLFYVEGLGQPRAVQPAKAGFPVGGQSPEHGDAA